MPKYDPDLIAALAEGRLDPDEAASLEREIATDPAATAELAAHRMVLEAIAATEAPRMTIAERSQLREAVSSALGVTAAEHTTTAATPRRRVPWGSLGIAAAALFGLVVIAPVVGLLSTGGSDSASLELAAEAPTTAAADMAAASADESREAPGLTAEDAVAEALPFGADPEDGAATFAPSTTVLRATTPAASQTEEVPVTTTIATPAPTTTMTATTTSTTAGTTTTTSAEIQQLTAELKAIKGDPADVEARSVAAGSTTACWEADTKVRPNPAPDRRAFPYDNPDFDVIVYFVSSAGQPGPFQVWNLVGCESVVVVP